ncbi:hypothetical protein RJ53_04315 [Methanocalculus chunghsingensis]|uniref:Uncharacterized protein n=1 Tax=Methanocalculus chunghsingensis TaxID=156457 RepID=A0A8J7W5P5_9EURY|nr:winged helix-turn-helix domain-containing protein [Methanocalculus chunghsingensis]MBR1368774.1 hypothetical protein [Methanocalculus chunghsingensis]
MNQTEQRSIRHLPPSAKLLYKVLESGGQMTQKELVTATSLSQRTVRYSLKRLKDEGYIVERYYFADARQSLYGLWDTAPSTGTV